MHDVVPYQEESERRRTIFVATPFNSGLGDEGVVWSAWSAFITRALMHLEYGDTTLCG